mgnify:CR=1 FL=1|tara:strand:+ start:482 stop:1000 length:519 start_codon:yes stop_codon:yes gene_type:complete
MTTRISNLTAELDAKRTKRTGLKIEHYQPRPDSVSSGGDCAVRSACWATGESYEAIFKELQDRADIVRSRPASILKAGTPFSVIKEFYRKRGWSWVEAKGELVSTEEKRCFGTIRSAKRVNALFKADNLPKQPCVAITTRHAVAVEDHVVLDSYDSRGDRSCVLEGYFVKKQ